MNGKEVVAKVQELIWRIRFRIQNTKGTSGSAPHARNSAEPQIISYTQLPPASFRFASAKVLPGRVSVPQD